MIKKIISWLYPLWIYVLILLVMRILMWVLPQKSDIALIISVFAYLNLTAFIYPLGLMLGWMVQCRSCLNSVWFQLMLAVVTFVVFLIIFAAFAYYDMRAMLMLDLLPSAVASCLFFIGELSTKKTQIRENLLKQHN